MQRFLSTVTILALVTHVTLGCCWHHAHACESNCCESPAAAANVCEARHHGHAVGDCGHALPALIADSQPQLFAAPADHHGSHSCEAGRCVTEWRSTRAAVPADDNAQLLAVPVAATPRLTSFSRPGPAATSLTTSPVPLESLLCIWRL